MNVLKLNLPPPSGVLRALVMSNLDELPMDPGAKKWLDNFHGGINCVAHRFDRVQNLEMQLNLEYKPYFPNRDIGAVIGVMKNTGSGLACLPPHCDRGRAIAINYYLGLGGSGVETVFYDQERSTGDESHNILYQDVSEISRHQFHEGWYAYNVCRAHSVEKIENFRYFLAIAFADSQYRVEDFAREYPSLVEQQYK